MQADYFRNLPAISILFPDYYEFAWVRRGVRLLIVKEFMVAYFYRSVIRNRIYLKAAIDELAGYLSADILLRTREDVRFGSGESALVMVKFNVCGINIRLQRYVATVICIKKKAVHCRDFTMQGRVGGSVCRDSCRSGNLLGLKCSHRD